MAVFLRRTPIFVALLLLIALAAPGQAQPPQPEQASCSIGGFPNVSCPVMTDAVIAQVAKSRVASIIRSSWAMQICVTNGVVSLTGTVPTQAQRDTAGIMAGTIRGVRGVSNNLRVAPPSGSDFTIMTAVMRAFGHNTYNTHQVHVAVADGVVTLTGVVTDEETRDMVILIPYQVPGVRSVLNQLTVRRRWSG